MIKLVLNAISGLVLLLYGDIVPIMQTPHAIQLRTTASDMTSDLMRHPIVMFDNPKTEAPKP